MIGQCGPPDGDLGDGGGRRTTLIEQPGRDGADQEATRGHAVEPGEEDADELERKRAPGPGRGVRWQPAREIRPDDEWPRTDQHGRPRSGEDAVGECVVRERAVRVDVPIDDLGDDVRRDHVDPLERGDDRLLRRGQGQPDGCQPGIGATFGGGRVDGLAQLGQTALTARRSRLDREVARRRTARRRARPPERDIDAFVVETLGELADGRDADLDDVDPDHRQGGGLPRSDASLGRHERGPDPWLVGIADEVEQFQPRRPVGIDPLQGRGAERPGRDLDRGATIAIVQDLGLEAEIDRPGRDIERQLLRGRLVFEQRRCERQHDPAGQPVRPMGHVAIDDLAGERAPGAVEAGHPEHPQERSLLPAGRAQPGPCAPRASERLGQLDQPIDRAQVACPRHARRPAAPRSPTARSTGRPGTTMPSRPVTVSATNRESMTASSVASTAAMKKRSR
jgi:hypothetical protein